MKEGDQVRVIKDCDVPKGTVGVVLKWDEQSGIDGEADWWVEHVLVKFPQGELWLTDGEVTVVGDWRDEIYLREERERPEREEKERKRIQETLSEFREMVKRCTR